MNRSDPISMIAIEARSIPEITHSSPCATRASSPCNSPGVAATWFSIPSIALSRPAGPQARPPV